MVVTVVALPLTLRNMSWIKLFVWSSNMSLKILIGSYYKSNGHSSPSADGNHPWYTYIYLRKLAYVYNVCLYEMTETQLQSSNINATWQQKNIQLKTTRLWQRTLLTLITVDRWQPTACICEWQLPVASPVSVNKARDIDRNHWQLHSHCHTLPRWLFTV